jgi:hypothetical protein
MRTPVRVLGVVGLLLGLIGATAAAVGAGEPIESSFDVTVYTCSTTDDSLVGTTEYIIGLTADQLDCVEQALADGVTVTLYDDADDSVLDSGVTAGGQVSLFAPVMGTLDFYLGEDANGTASEPEEIAEGQDAIATIILFVDADGELEITKTDQETGDPIEGAGFTLFSDDCQTAVSDEVLTDANGVATFADILAGDYCVIETTIPEGYLAVPAPISVTITAGGTEPLAVPNEAAPLPGEVLVTKYVCEDDDLAGTVEFDFLLGVDVSGCEPGVDYELSLEDAEGAVVDTQATDDAGLAQFVELPAGDYTLVEGAAESEVFTVGENETIDVNVINYVEEEGGQVLVSAFTCEGTQAAVEIEVSEPTAPEQVEAQGDDELCEPAPFLGVSIYLFGDEGSEPIVGNTDEDGTILFGGIPPTDEGTGPHLFRTVVFDSDFEADFDVEDDALTAITVLIFLPPAPTPTVEPTAAATDTPAPTATTGPGTTATAAPTGTIATLPGTGAGSPLTSGGSAAWLLIACLGLLGFGAVGYALRRRAA